MSLSCSVITLTGVSPAATGPPPNPSTSASLAASVSSSALTVSVRVVSPAENVTAPSSSRPPTA